MHSKIVILLPHFKDTYVTEYSLHIGITAEAIIRSIGCWTRKNGYFWGYYYCFNDSHRWRIDSGYLAGHYPLGWVKNPHYFLIVTGAAILTVFIAPFHQTLYTLLPYHFLVLDALGLIVFSIIGILNCFGHGAWFYCYLYSRYRYGSLLVVYYEIRSVTAFL